MQPRNDPDRQCACHFRTVMDKPAPWQGQRTHNVAATPRKACPCRLPVRATPYGKRQRTLRQVLEYSPQSRNRDSALKNSNFIRIT